MTSIKVSSGKNGVKYLIEYNNDDKIKSLRVMLPKMSEYVKCFDETKYISFLIGDEELLKAYIIKCGIKLTT